MTHDEMIAVIQAHKEGRAVEWQWLPKFDPDGWRRLISPDHPFNFSKAEYRIKPEPREWWFVKNNPTSDFRSWSRHEVRQLGIGELEQIHVREVLE